MITPLKIGDHIVVLGRGDRQLYTCVVTNGDDQRFRSRSVDGVGEDFERAYTEEGTLWARGWDYKDALVLQAALALENSR